MGGEKWKVVGGADKGGITVRGGVKLTSTEFPLKLATGSIILQKERSGERLRYGLLEGKGPPEGWVSVRLKDKALLEPVQEPLFAPPAKSAPPTGSRAAPKAAAAGTATAPPGNPFAAAAAQQQQEAKPAVNADASYEARVQALRDQYPGFEEQLPAEAQKWSQKDLENYFESGGFIKPKPGRPAQAQQSSPSSPPRRSCDEVPDVDQMPMNEALKLQEKLKEGFRAKEFQERLAVLQRKYPHRKERGHEHGARYFEAFEALVVSVYSRVLPKYGLKPDWEGVREMYARLHTALQSGKVKKNQEEINILLGLPRDAVFKPSKKSEDVPFVYCEQRDGNCPGYILPTVCDESDDEAHEFLVEDPETGELQTTKLAVGCKPTGGRRKP